jgi:hypothetical protein
VPTAIPGRCERDALERVDPRQTPRNEPCSRIHAQSSPNTKLKELPKSRIRNKFTPNTRQNRCKQNELSFLDTSRAVGFSGFSKAFYAPTLESHVDGGTNATLHHIGLPIEGSENRQYSMNIVGRGI